MANVDFRVQSTASKWVYLPVKQQLDVSHLFCIKNESSEWKKRLFVKNKNIGKSQDYAIIS